MQADPTELNRVLERLITCPDEKSREWARSRASGYRKTFTSKGGLSPKQLRILLNFTSDKDINPDLTKIPMTLATKEGVAQLYSIEESEIFWEVQGPAGMKMKTKARLRPSMSEAQIQKWQAELDIWKPLYEAAGIKVGVLAAIPRSPSVYKERVLEWQGHQALIERSGLPVELCYGSDIKVGDIFCYLRSLEAHMKREVTIGWMKRLPPKKRPAFKKGSPGEYIWNVTQATTGHHISVRNLGEDKETSIDPLTMSPFVKWLGEGSPPQ